MPPIRYGLFALFFLAALPARSQVVPCTDGVAQPVGSSISYACKGIDFLSRMPRSAIGSNGDNSDIWGWTDPENGDEYVIAAVYNGTAFVRITDPLNPVYLGRLDSHTFTSYWRDMKVYADHAYIVSEASGHGMQVFDLTQLRGVTESQAWEETAHYNGVGSAHNIAINEATGFAYIVGAKQGTESACAQGLHMIDLSSPTIPAFAGCYAEDGYTHDTQCVVYDGPDTRYTGREICFAFNEDTVTIVDVTEKAAPDSLSQATYPNTAYTHQGWLTEDHRFLIGNDELDERNYGLNTRTLIFDVRDLKDPSILDVFSHETVSIDHNAYVKGNYVYETNYTAGLRVLDASALLNGEPGMGLEEIAFFDTYSPSNATTFNGAWSSYPYFESGTIAVNDINYGLFLLQLNLDGRTAKESVQPGTFALGAVFPNPFTDRTQFSLRVGDAQFVSVEVYDVLGRRVAEVFQGPVGADQERTFVFDGSGLPAGSYFLRVTGERFTETRQLALTR